jgi:hypothetical protein
MIRIVNTILILLLAFSFISCEEKPDPTPLTLMENVVYILNEGTATFNNSSLSIYSPDSNRVENNVFEKVNQVPFGDVAQSMVKTDDLIYMVINNSGKIYAIDSESYEFAGKVTGLTSPRYIAFASNEKAYISDLYDSVISVFHPKTFELLSHIDLGRSSEQMIVKNNYLYVLSWSYDRMLTKIDIQSDQIVESLEIGLQPQSMVEDINGKLWILCDGGYAGNPAGHENPRLVRVDPEQMAIEKSFEFEMSSYPLSELSINSEGRQMYFINYHIFSMDIDDQHLPTEPAIEKGSRNIYSLGIDPEEGDIYLGDAASYVQQGIVFRYDRYANLLDSFYVGVNPGYIYFDNL